MRIPSPFSTTASPAWVLATACLGYAMVIIDTTAVNVALPAIGAGLGGSLEGLQWTVDGYVLVFAALLVIGGSLGDRFGPARLFRSGVVVFILASLGCALAPSLGVLLASRAAQGVGAALLAPACLALIAHAYEHDAAARTRATAIFATAAGSPQAFGPLLGGALVQLAGWRAIFWINLPVGLAALVLAARLGHGRDATNARLPLLGHVSVLATMAGLTAFIIEAPKHGATSTTALTAAAVTVLSAAALVRHQRTATSPAISRDLLNSAATRFIAVGLLLFAGYYGLNFVLTLYLQQDLHITALGTGIVVLAAALPIFALPLITNRLVRRLGARLVLAAGLTFVAAGAALLTAGVINTPLLREAALALLGIGVGLSVTPQITLVIDASPDNAVSQASGVLNAARQLGTVLGVATLGTVASLPPRPAEGVALAAAVAIALAAAALISATRFAHTNRARASTDTTCHAAKSDQCRAA